MQALACSCLPTPPLVCQCFGSRLAAIQSTVNEGGRAASSLASSGGSHGCCSVGCPRPAVQPPLEQQICCCGVWHGLTGSCCSRADADEYGPLLQDLVQWSPLHQLVPYQRRQPRWRAVSVAGRIDTHLNPLSYQYEPDFTQQNTLNTPIRVYPAKARLRQQIRESVNGTWHPY
jgi:hypothetical protein